jgi:hypothetical protein
MMRNKGLSAVLAGAALLAGASGCSRSKDEIVSSRSYKGHESDADILNFVNVYPKTVGTRLDDCKTCHTSFELTKAGKRYTKSVCDYCHLITHPDREDDGSLTAYDQSQPTTIEETLNTYGLAYRAAGSSRQALLDIEGLDSDGDSYTNAAEIEAGRLPGDDKSMPGQQDAPLKVLTVAQVRAMTPVHSEFLLANATKQQYDSFATYDGLKIRDLLAAAGVDPDSTEVSGVTVIAPDGFTKDYQMTYGGSPGKYGVNDPFPAGQYQGGLDTTTLGTACGFVTYPSTVPAARIAGDGVTILDEQWLMLAYGRDGAPLDQAYLDSSTLRLSGEGPLRLVVPQAKPGVPDRGSQYPTSCGDAYEFDSSKDHNAGAMVRGVIAIRINPLPDGLEDFDYRNGGYDYLANGQFIVYGHGISGQ